MLRYELEGGNLPVVTCYLESGDIVCSERGAMSWMSSNIQMSTNAGGGFKKAVGRLLSGESFFLNEFMPLGGSGTITFASSFPGAIIPFKVTPTNGIIIQKRGFLAMEKGLDLSVYLQKNIGSGFFGGDGFIMQKISGDGMVFIEVDGHSKEVQLNIRESILVDTGCVAAMTDSCTMDVEMVKGVKNMFFGGEGLFLTRITGPGMVYLQSMPIANTARTISPYLNITQNSKKSE